MKKIFVLAAVILMAVAVGALVAAPNIERLLIFKMAPAPLNTGGKNLAEELGYPANAKLLVVNSDDTGGHPAFTEGVFDVMEKGLVKSTSVIVHNRNDQDLIRIAEVSQQHPDWGIGIHLALTNEYQQAYPWTPVLPKETVPSLYNEKGLSWEKISEVEVNVDPVDAEKEFEAQVKKALRLGIRLTHIDSHMGTLYRNSQFPGAQADALRNAAIQVAIKYQLPITMNTFDEKSQSSMAYMDEQLLIRPDTFFGFYELADMNANLSYEGPWIKRWIVAKVVKTIFGFDLPYQNYENLADDVEVRMVLNKQAILNIIKPGLNHFFMHASVPTSASGDAIPSGKNHKKGVDSIVRLADSEVWASDEMKSFLAAQGVILINYTQIKKIQEQRYTKNTRL